MGRNSTIIPHGPLARLLKDDGIDRVAKEAAILLSEHLEQRGKQIAHRSSELAQHTARNTILDRDVRMAEKER